MGASTEISWTDATWNPIRGCSRVSAGCDNCYAMGQAHRFSGPGKPFEGLTTIRRGKVDWAGVARFIPNMLGIPLRWRKPRRIFVNSMSDLFHPSLSNEEIAAVFAVMAACPQHTFQVLTKQPKRAAEWFKVGEDLTAQAGEQLAAEKGWCHANEGEHWPLPNVWFGVSAENQKTADDRLSILLELPAAVRFASLEPLLEETSVWAFLKGGVRDRSLAILGGAPLPGLDWVIVGGESGTGARPFDIAWAEQLVKQCRTAGVPIFVKQLGAVPFDSRESDRQSDDPHSGSASTDLSCRLDLADKKGGDPSEWPEALRVREFPKVPA
jgi:protein gp37